MMKTGALGMLLLAAATSGGCISTYRKALQEREAQIQTLKEENTSLRASLDESRAREHLLQGGSTNPTLVQASATKMGDDVELSGTREKLDGTGVATERRNGRIVMTLPEEITFASGKASLSTQGKTTLKKVSELLKNQYKGRTIWVEGHTDNEPIRKSGFKSNRQLSIERSMAVSEFLKEDAGIEDSRMVVAGHGEFAPVADNSNADGRKKNRRVEIIIGD